MTMFSDEARKASIIAAGKVFQCLFGLEQFIEYVAEPSLEHVHLLRCDRHAHGPVIDYTPGRKVIMAWSSRSASWFTRIIIEISKKVTPIVRT